MCYRNEGGNVNFRPLRRLYVIKFMRLGPAAFDPFGEGGRKFCYNAPLR